jgi:hypothetical protein
MPEWGNPTPVMRCDLVRSFRRPPRGEPGELKHLSTPRKSKQAVISLVAASEREKAQTDLVKKRTGVARSGSWDRAAEAVNSARSKKPLL